jgi:hypothetical protein
MEKLRATFWVRIAISRRFEEVNISAICGEILVLVEKSVLYENVPS